VTRRLSIALERYDRHVPFFMGLMSLPPPLAFEPLEVGMVPPQRRDGSDRHGRMLRQREFDIAETSLSSYLIAKARGSDLTAVPVFPRRLFSASNIFVRVASRVERPSDLVDKRVGVFSFQTTFSVLARGDLKFEYGVPWERIRWVSQHREELPLGAMQGVSVEYAGGCQDIGAMLLAGELDAVLHPHPSPTLLQAGGRVRRLFEDSVAESTRYYSKHGYFPVMHLLVVKPEVFALVPRLGPLLMGAWDEAKRMAVKFWEDPGYGVLAFGRQHMEAQEQALGADIWRSGLAANRANLERFVMYAVDQGLIPQTIPVEALFHASTLDS
jgi:4,5-dihydroxyphthalate decarboxylase